MICGHQIQEKHEKDMKAKTNKWEACEIKKDSKKINEKYEKWIEEKSNEWETYEIK